MAWLGIRWTRSTTLLFVNYFIAVWQCNNVTLFFLSDNDDNNRGCGGKESNKIDLFNITGFLEYSDYVTSAWISKVRHYNESKITVESCFRIFHFFAKFHSILVLFFGLLIKRQKYQIFIIENKQIEKVFGTYRKVLLICLRDLINTLFIILKNTPWPPQKWF